MDNQWNKEDHLIKDEGAHARKESLQDKLNKAGGKAQRKVDETVGDKALADKGADQEFKGKAQAKPNQGNQKITDSRK